MNYLTITKETHPDSPELRRVKALRDMPTFGVKKGDLGGWVQVSEHLSLALDGTAWIGRGAKVWGGTIWGGTIWGGTIWGGTIWGGTIWGGTIRGGTIWGGTIRGGTIEGGTIRGGTIWGGTILYIAGLPSEALTCYPGDDGWVIHIGCWTGTPTTLAALIKSEVWPGASSQTERDRRRPSLKAALALVKAHIALNPDVKFGLSS